MLLLILIFICHVVLGHSPTSISGPQALLSYPMYFTKPGFPSVPPPILTITGSPRNTSFFQGLDLTFTCTITLDEVVDSPVTVRGSWNRNGTIVMDGADDGRITINNPLMSAAPYQTTLRFNLLKISDAGTYKCVVTVTPQNTTFLATATASISRTIAVAGIIMT